MNIKENCMNPISVIFLLHIVTAGSLAFSAEDDPQDIPNYSVTDSRGVNLLTLKKTYQIGDVNVGSGDLSLSHSIASYSDSFISFLDSYVGTIQPAPIIPGVSTFQVSYGSFTSLFKLTDGIYTDLKETGATLVATSTSTLLYTAPNGAQIHYSKDIHVTIGRISPGYFASATKVIFPSGLTVDIHFKADPQVSVNTRHRVQSVTTNNGLQLKYVYQSNSSTSSGWARLTKVIAINNVFEGCNPVADLCVLEKNWPTATYEYPVGPDSEVGNFTVTSPEGGRNVYQHSRVQDGVSNSTYIRLTGIIDSTSAGELNTLINYASIYSVTYELIRAMTVDEVIIDGKTWNYYSTTDTGQYGPIDSRVEGPDGVTQVRASKLYGTPYYIKETDGTQFHISSDFKNRLDRIDYPFGNSTHYYYDSIGNLVEKREKGEPSAALADRVMAWGYLNTCGTEKTQKNASWFKDARGNQTDYTFHCASGSVSKVTQPADSQGIRPETRYFYQQRYAYYKNGAGEVVQASSPIWLLAKESTCKVGAAAGDGCAIASDEVVTIYEYANSNTPNNLFLRGIDITDKATNEVRRTCFTYDEIGNQSSVTAPKGTSNSCI